MQVHAGMHRKYMHTGIAWQGRLADKLEGHSTTQIFWHSQLGYNLCVKGVLARCFAKSVTGLKV